MKALPKPVTYVYIFLILFCVYCGESLGAIASSDYWDGGSLNDWRGNTAWTQVSVVTTGGNPVGYLSSTSKPGGNPSNTIGAVNESYRYTGNYTAAGVNQVSFDLKLVSGQVGWVAFRVRYHDARYNGWYYRLRSTPLTITHMSPVLPLGEWVHFDVPINPNWTDAEAKAAGWEQEPTSPSFSETMSDVYTVEIRLYSSNLGNTTLGIDNFVLYADRPGPITTAWPPNFQERLTGLWYDRNKPGNGIAIEMQGQKAFIAWFSFERHNNSGNETAEDNATSWVACSGNVTRLAYVSCPAQKWVGWQWGQAYSEPVVSEQPFRMEAKFNYTSFNDDSNDFINFYMYYLGPLPFKSKHLVRFMRDFSPGDPDSRNLTGWWYDPAYNGMGFFIEARGGTLVLVWYNYGDNGAPRWWTTSGDFPDGAQTYTGVLDGWHNGECFLCSYYKQPWMVPGEAGNITINFIDSSHATVEINGITLNIQRFTIP